MSQPPVPNTPTTRRIYLTGMGIVSPVGTGEAPFWSALHEGRSGVQTIQAFDTGGFGTKVTAEVRDFEPKKAIKNRKAIKVMARDIQLAVGAARYCLEDAGFEAGAVDPTRFGVNCGAGLIATELDELGPAVAHSVDPARGEFDLGIWGKEGLQRLYPLWMLKYLPNMPACHISIIHDAQGPNNSITAAEASTALAIGEAYRVITRDAADCFLAGGCDSRIHPLSIVRLALLGHLSPGEGDPAAVCRPFDVARTGVVPGEGASLFLLEEATHATARGAKVYGEIVGFGSACHPQRGEAIERAVVAALADAGLRASDLGFVLPTGTGCQEDDRLEATALAKVLGAAAESPPVVACKGYFGYTGAASGALEVAAGLLALQHGYLPPSLNFTELDADLPKLNLLREGMSCPDRPFLTYDVNHSGQCGALIVRPAS